MEKNAINSWKSLVAVPVVFLLSYIRISIVKFIIQFPKLLSSSLFTITLIQNNIFHRVLLINEIVYSPFVYTMPLISNCVLSVKDMVTLWLRLPSADS